MIRGRADVELTGLAVRSRKVAQDDPKRLEGDGTEGAQDLLQPTDINLDVKMMDTTHDNKKDTISVEMGVTPRAIGPRLDARIFITLDAWYWAVFRLGCHDCGFYIDYAERTTFLAYLSPKI